MITITEIARVHTGDWNVTGDSELQPATVILDAANVPVADVYWGYWISGYNVSGPVAHDIEGGFHYIFSNDSFVGSVDISAQTPILFNLLQPSPLSSDQGVNPSLSLTGGFLDM